MLVYRIIFASYGDSLTPSGRAARWNPNEINVIYTVSSRSLACLENAVHRSQSGLSQLFAILTIEIPDSIQRDILLTSDLQVDWTDYTKMYVTQRIGEQWIHENKTAVLQVPSSIIEEEVNYLLNPMHPDFKRIKIIKSRPFVFDKRIKD